MKDLCRWQILSPYLFPELEQICRYSDVQRTFSIYTMLTCHIFQDFISTFFFFITFFFYLRHGGILRVDDSNLH